MVGTRWVTGVAAFGCAISMAWAQGLGEGPPRSAYARRLETNQGKQEFKNICVPEGADQEEYLQRMMAEQQRNKQREEKEKARLKQKALEVCTCAATCTTGG